MENLNAEQIIKALECCTRGRKSKDDRPCLDCPYNECNLVGGTSERQTTGTCQGWLMKDALSLIKELTEDNERLRNWCENKIVLDNDELKEVKTACLERIKLDVKRIKTDTVRKFAKRLKEYYNELSGKTFPPLVAYHIEQIEKEMLEDRS